MDYELQDVDYDPFAQEPTPKGDTYKRPQPKISETDVLRIPAADTFTLPKVIDEGAKPEKPAAAPLEYELQDVDYDPFAKPAEKPGVISNIARGVGERALQLVGGTAGVIGNIAEGAGDYADMYLGKPVWDENGLSWRRLTEEETKGRSSWITQKLEEVRKGLEDPDLGYDARTTWQDVKDAPLSNVIPFALEQGLVSAADMYVAVKNLPGYVLEQTGEISQTRAENEGRKGEPTFGDMVKALPAAAVSAWMEKIGTSKMLGLDDVALTELKQLPKELFKTLLTEGATEAAQEAAMIGGEQAFTNKGIDWWQAMERVAQSALVGSIFGPAVKAPIAGVQIATAPGKEEEVVEPAADTEGQSTPQQPAGKPQGPESGVSTPGTLGGTPPPPPKDVVADQPIAAAPVVTDVDPDVAVAAGAPAAVKPAAGAIPEPDEEEDFFEPEAGRPAAMVVEEDERARRMRDLFREENERARKDEEDAKQAQVEVLDATNPGEAITAAMGAAAGVKPYTGQALGTPGNRLEAVDASRSPPQAVQAAAPAPVVPSAGAATPTEGAAIPTGAPPAPAVDQNVIPETPVPVSAARPPVTPAVAPAAVAAPAIPELPSAEGFGEFTQQAGADLRAPVITPALDKTDEQRAAERAEREARFDEAYTAATGLQPPTRKSKQAESVVKTPTLSTQEPAAPKPRVEGKLTLKPKAEAAKAVSKAKEEPAATIIKKGQAAAPAPAPAAPSPPRSPAVRDTAERALLGLRSSWRESASTMAELGDADVREAVDKAAEEAVAASPRKPGESPREHLDRLAPDVQKRAEETLKPKQEAADTAREKKATKTYKIEKKEEKAEKSEKKLREGTAQERERYDKEGNKSPEGIRAESEKATRGRITDEMVKPEAERDPHLMAWAKLHEEETVRGKKKATPERRAEIQEQKKQLQEARAAKSERRVGLEALATEEAKETQRAKDVGKVVRDVLADQGPMPSDAEIARQARAANKSAADTVLQIYAADRKSFVEKVRAALKAAGLELSGKRDWTRQSDEENLAHWGAEMEATAGKPKRTEWGMARIFLAAGNAHSDLKGLIGTEQSQGAGTDKVTGDRYQLPNVDQDTSWAGKPETTSATETASFADFVSENIQARKTGVRKGGREGATERHYGRSRRAAAVGGPDSISVTDNQGRRHSFETESMSAEHALRTNLTGTQFEEQAGRSSFLMIRNVLTSQLIKAVGDVKVHFASAQDVETLAGRGAVGGYVHLSQEARARGEKPYVIIRNDLSPAEHSHTLIHELVHAATSQALDSNVRGTKEIFSTMMKEFNKTLSMEFSPSELRQYGLEYGFENEFEFLAEAMSNERFQSLLKSTPLPSHLRSMVSALGEGRTPSWWSAFTDAVSNAVGLFMGRKGQTYMDNVLTLYSHLERSSAAQTIAAQQEVHGKATVGKKNTFKRQSPEMRLQARLAGDAVEQGVLAAREAKANAFNQKGKLLYKGVSTHELIRQAESLWGGARNAFEKLADLHVKAGELYRKYRTNPGAGIDSAHIEEQLAKLGHRHRGEATALADVLNEGTAYQANITVPLSDPTNKHLVGKGDRKRQARAAHARLYAEFQKLQPDTQRVGRETIEHLRKAGELESRKFMESTLGQAIKEYRLEPKLAAIGKTEKDAVDWLMRDRAAVDPANQTQEDKDFHSALGSTAQTLANVPELKRIKGMFVPLRREGKWVLAGKNYPFGKVGSPKNLPRGATLDADNVLVFKNQKDMQDFVDTFQQPATVATRYFDTSGQRIRLAAAAPGQHVNKAWAVTFQNQIMEQGDYWVGMKARAAELRAQGYEISDVRKSKEHLYKLAEEISPAQIKRVVNHLRQTTVGSNTATQEATEKAVYDAYIRSLTTPGHLQSRLKRRNVMGAHKDLFKAVRGYNQSLGHTLANYELKPQMAEAEKEANDYINDQARNNAAKDTGDTIKRQVMLDELIGRMKDTRQGDPNPFMNGLKKVTFLRHLASPHHTIINLLQPLYMGIPALSPHLGRGRTWRLMMGAYNMGATLKTMGKGFREVVRWKRERQYRYDDYWYAAAGQQQDGAELHQLYDEMEARGIGANSGVEATISEEAGMGYLGVGLNRLVGIASQLPAAAEAVNRYTTATAAYRGAREMGKSVEDARRWAVHMVEQTQGGYDANNHAAWMAKPLFAPFAQFRKFSVTYGQQFWRNFAWGFFKGQDPATRKQARQTVVRLSVTGAIFAGLFGNPLMEIVKWIVNGAAALGWKEDDWDEDKSDIQKAFSEVLEWAGASDATADTISEMTLRGWSRAIDLDLSNAMGADSLVAFRTPQDLEDESIYEYFGRMIAGAPGEVALEAKNALLNWDWTELPLPKIVHNLRESIELMNDGVVSKKTGQQYVKPIGALEGTYKILGLKPATPVRSWEGGTGSKSKENRKTRHDRTMLMGRWSSASPSERHRIWREEVREWNRAHRRKEERIDMADLQKSRETRRKRQKELEKQVEEED